MTKEELKQYRSIVAEIKELNKSIRDNTVHDTVKGSDKDYPYTQHTMSVEGGTKENEAAYVRRQKLKQQRDDIKHWVDSIPDSLTRRIFRYKYINGNRKMTWVMVARAIYPELRRDTAIVQMADTLRKNHENYLKSL